MGRTLWVYGIVNSRAQICQMQLDTVLYIQSISCRVVAIDVTRERSHTLAEAQTEVEADAFVGQLLAAIDDGRQVVHLI